MIEHPRAKENESKLTLGFWIYLMTDCVLFASLFATYAVLRNNTAGGSSSLQLFNLHTALSETLILLTSSFVCGLAMLAIQRKDRHKTLLALGITFVLGLTFLTIELAEFRHLGVEGNSWRSSGFLSAFFTLVGTHGLHILGGLIWLAVMITQVARKGLTAGNSRKLMLFSLFWHFLDIIWIFIFTLVYLMGAIKI